MTSKEYNCVACDVAIGDVIFNFLIDTGFAVVLEQTSIITRAITIVVIAVMIIIYFKEIRHGLTQINTININITIISV